MLKAHRPNLLLVGLDTHPTGLLVVAGLDPAERALRERYDLIVRAAWDQKDAPPPGDILARAGAIAPDSRKLTEMLRWLAAVPDVGTSAEAVRSGLGRWRRTLGL